MTFTNPIFLWAFLSLIPLVAIYLLKVRPSRKTTTAYFLWENILQQKQTQTLFRKLRDVFSLLLMLLAFTAIVLAMANPIWKDINATDMVLLIDNSASMNAKDGKPTRLDAAKSEAAQIVRALDGRQRCSVATVSNQVRFLSNMTDNPRDLLDAIDAIQPSNLPTSPIAFDLFQQETGEVQDVKLPNDNTVTDSQHRVILISDGCFDEILPNSVELMNVVDQPEPNAGIIACDLQRLSDANRIGVFYQLSSTYQEPVEVDLVLSQGSLDNVVQLVPVSLQPGINPAETFELDNAVEGRWFLSLEIQDSLTLDNLARMVLPPRRPIDVQVFAGDRFFYENSILAFSNNSGLLNLVDDGGQLFIGQGSYTNQSEKAASNRDRPPNQIVFRPDGESPWWSELGEEIEVTLPRVKDDSHPAIRHLDFESIRFTGARRISAPHAAEIWVESEDGIPLIFQSTRSGQSTIVVNLDPLASEFYLSSWFPVLVYSSAVHLSGRSQNPRSSYAAGEGALIPGATAGEITTLTFPDQTEIKSNKNLTPALNDLGFYQMSNTHGDWEAACSLLSDKESNLNVEYAGNDIQPIRRGYSLQHWLAVLAILFIGLESVLYQLRKVG